MGPFDLEKLETMITRNATATLLAIALLAILGLFLALQASHRRERETLLQIAPVADKALDLLERVSALVEDLLDAVETRAPSRARRRAREGGGGSNGTSEQRTEGEAREPGAND